MEGLRAENVFFALSLIIGTVSFVFAFAGDEEKHRKQGDHLVKAAIWLGILSFVVLFLK